MLVGCGGTCGEALVSAHTPSARPAIEPLKVAGVALPTLPVWIAGVRRPMLLDTGTSTSIFGAGFLFLAGARATDVVRRAETPDGGVVDVVRYEPLERIVWLPGAELVDGAWGTSMPAFEVLAGIGGVLSPQRLAPEGHVVRLDLRARVIAVEPLDASALASMVPLAPVCAGRFAVDARVAGSQARLVVDTGAARSSFAGASSGRAAGSERLSTLAGAREVALFDIDVELGGARFAAVAHDDGPPCADANGRLGLDVLARCALVLGRDVGGISCTEGAP